MAKSLTVAFLLWGTLGLFGAHHFYLRRDRHGVAHLVTLGGFVIGWLYDAFRLRDYVQWANSDGELKERCVEKMESCHSFLSGVAQACLAHLLWSAVRSAIEDYIPDHLEPFVMPFLLTLILAYAVYYLGNIGDSEGSFWSAAEGALLTVPYYMYNPDGATSWCLVVSGYTFRDSARSRPKPEDHGSKLRRLCYNALLVGIILSLASMSLFYNCTVSADEDEPEFRCVDAMGMLYNRVRYNGFGFLLEAVFAASPEDDAAHVLGVSENASENEIKAIYKKLARQYHPDKVKDPEERLKAHQKFVEIAAAYELLSGMKAKRARTNP